MKKSILFTLLLCALFSFKDLYAQCPPSGDIELLSQSDIDNFVTEFPNCDTIDGNLIIKGNTITNISGLKSLRIIKGHLKLEETSISNFTGLSFLTEVGGVYSEVRNNANLLSVELENLTKFDSYLSIGGNSNLTDIIGFENLDKMKSIEISHNFNLQSIPKFSNLLTVESLSVSENENMRIFDGFTNLECISEDFQIHGNDRLETIPKFNKVKTISGFSFRISLNPLLKDILGFESLEAVNCILIIDTNGWRNSEMPISSFPNLKEIQGSLFLKGALSTVNGFNKLRNVGGITISGTKAKEIVGFENLKEAGEIEIKEHFGFLTKVDAFHNLEVINGDFNLFNNRQLAEINGFEKVHTIKWDIQIGSNFELTNLDFFRSLINARGPFADRMSIGFNPKLSDCTGIATLLEYGTTPDRIDISNNLNKCNSVNEIISNADKDKDGVINSIDLDDDNDGIYDSFEDIGDNDVDGDLIPNSLDLNSDNDGCFDVNEAGLEDADNNGIIGDSAVEVDENGLVTNFSSAYLPPNDIDSNSISDFLDIEFSPIISEQPASQRVPANNTVIFKASTINADVFQWEISYDDKLTWENLQPNTIFSGEQTAILTINNAALNLNNTVFRLKIKNSNSPCGNYVISNEVYLKVENSNLNPGINTSLSFCPNDAVLNLYSSINGNPDAGGYWLPELKSRTNMFDPNQDSAGTYKYYLETTDCTVIYSEVQVSIENNNAGTNGNISICEVDSPVNLMTSLGNNPDLGGAWTPDLSSGTGIFNPLEDVSGTYTYTVSNGACGSATSEVIVNVIKAPNAGLDGILTICENESPVNLFDSLTGNPDLGGIWSSNVSSDNSGFFNPASGSEGVYTYTVGNGTCSSVTSEVNVIVKPIPNSGTSGSLIICKNYAPVNLFGSLGNNPDNGGVWSPALNSGTGIFNPETDVAGVYNYTVDNGSCGNSTTEITVQIEDIPSAGMDGSLSICENNSSVNLFDSLGGNPDLNGIWTPSLSSGTGVFNPLEDSSGVYIYTVDNGVCSAVSAEVNVTVEAIPDSGMDGELSICINSNAIDLFENLGGNPDVDGIWTPALRSGTGVFNPTDDVAGTYIYTISNGSCNSVSSQVEVEVFDTYEIQNYTIEIEEFVYNKSIVINISESGVFEYSIDGINYQLENTFNNLESGDYLVSIREIDGCGTLSTEVSILDYPKYFTPNGDGVNDVWKLTGTTDKEYTISIYNRFGKMVKFLKNKNESWNGEYNGTLMDSNDYWFKLQFSEGKIVDGNFSLLR
jgi:gliding motility-associated-like protein